MTNELVPIVQAATPQELRSSIGTSLADVWQALVGDRISAYRLKNAAAISEKLSRNLSDRGHNIDWEKVPERFAVSWFEHATKEDENTIQELFATLLERAAEGSLDALERRNVELVGRLSPSDALLLQSIYEEYSGKFTNHEAGYLWLDDWEIFLRNTKRSDCPIDEISYENLQNLGIFEVERITTLDSSKLERWLKGQIGQDGGSFFTTYPVEDAVQPIDEVNLTQTGISLVRALF